MSPTPTAGEGRTARIIRLDELQLWRWMDDRPGICRRHDRLRDRVSFTLGYLDGRDDAHIDLIRETGAEARPRIRRIVAEKQALDTGLRQRRAARFARYL